MTKRVDKENIFGLTATLMKVNGKMTKKMVKAQKLVLMAKSMLVNG